MEGNKKHTACTLRLALFTGVGKDQKTKNRRIGEEMQKIESVHTVKIVKIQNSKILFALPEVS